ncbi:MAG: hypothetical protein OXG82_17225 [Gammaproteobacteria bacterium]|nr:hypothetical protein [Gammaproteobacteria bacterium]
MAAFFLSMVVVVIAIRSEPIAFIVAIPATLVTTWLCWRFFTESRVWPGGLAVGAFLFLAVFYAQSLWAYWSDALYAPWAEFTLAIASMLLAIGVAVIGGTLFCRKARQLPS